MGAPLTPHWRLMGALRTSNRQPMDPLSVRGALVRNLRGVHGAAMRCSRVFGGSPMKCTSLSREVSVVRPCGVRASLSVRGVPRGYRWVTREVSVGRPWVRRSPIGCPWSAHGPPMGRPWVIHGVSVGLSLWRTHFPVGFPWIVGVASTGHRWSAHGAPMGLTRNAHEMRKQSTHKTVKCCVQCCQSSPNPSQSPSLSHGRRQTLVHSPGLSFRPRQIPNLSNVCKPGIGPCLRNKPELTANPTPCLITC